jgi:hypothetical protein
MIWHGITDKILHALYNTKNILQNSTSTIRKKVKSSNARLNKACHPYHW